MAKVASVTFEDWELHLLSLMFLQARARGVAGVCHPMTGEAKVIFDRMASRLESALLNQNSEQGDIKTGGLPR